MFSIPCLLLCIFQHAVSQKAPSGVTTLLLLYVKARRLTLSAAELILTTFPPPPDNAQSQALAGILVQLHGEGVPQVFLLVLGLVPVDRQPDPVRRLPQHVDGFVVTGRSQVDAVHL